MDFLQSGHALFQNLRYLRDQAQDLRSPDTISSIADHIVNFFLPPSSSSSSTSSSTLSNIQHDYIDPYILAPMQSFLGSTGSSNDGGMPNLLSLLALVVIAFISFKVLDYVRRVVMWWIMLAVKLCLVLVVVQVGWYVSQYGWEKTLNDAGWIWGILEGFVGETGTQASGVARGSRAGATGRGRQQVPLGHTKGSRRRWN